MSDLDKDIKTLKKLKTEKDIETGYKTYLLDTEQQQAIENVLSELETYKKITEKLAIEYMYADQYCDYSNAGDVIDWARKEVEKNNE